jgi:FtsP/CotA-like multicopper oxidase with cupredoxin domain
MAGRYPELGTGIMNRASTGRRCWQEDIGMEYSVEPFPDRTTGTLKVAEFKVVSSIRDSNRLPEKLAVIERPNVNDAVNTANPRRFHFQMQMMQMMINGRTFEMDAVASDEIVTLNTTEVWEVMNAGPMPMPHPVHIHGLQFRVLDRSGSPADLKDGYVDSGWKDTVLLMPGERARLLLRFEDFSGLYLYHCHNLEHEDLGMMRNYRVVG